jgi:hypothetical protein
LKAEETEMNLFEAVQNQKGDNMEILTRILTAFDALRDDGYFALPDWDTETKYELPCCGSCGVDELPSQADYYDDDEMPSAKVDRYVFFHMQDADCLRSENYCHLNWGGDRAHIVRRLEEAGLSVEARDEQSRIRVAMPEKT